MKNLIKFLFIILFFLISQKSISQIPTNLRGVNPSTISDQQLRQLYDQMNSKSMSESQVYEQLKSRGMSDPDIQILISRAKALNLSTTNQTDQGGQNFEEPIKRSYKPEFSNSINEVFEYSRLFGADLFKGTNPIFIPNYKIATPKSYIIGPDDELQFDIFGNNSSSQKLIVNPDGVVNIKYLGPVNISGLTIDEASEIIKSRLLKYYPALSSGDTKLRMTLGGIRSIRVSVIGAVNKPGSITIPSISTVYNALYMSGGPAENASLRGIQLIRNGKIISNADLYDFIFYGSQNGNDFLRDNDVIRVPYATSLIFLGGAVNKEALFEMKSNETFSNLIIFCGGFKGNALTEIIGGTRFTGKERKIIDIPRNKFNEFTFLHGDSLFVDTIINKYENRAYVTGEVYKPGAYAIDESSTIAELIKKAQGYKEEALLKNAFLYTHDKFLNKISKQIDIEKLLSTNESIRIRKDDSLHIPSIYSIHDSATITISGAVKYPGTYTFIDSMTLSNLLIKAGGFIESATPSKIEIGRRKKNFDLNSVSENNFEIIVVDVEKYLNDNNSRIFLQPSDFVSVKYDPFKVKSISVKVSGEVKYPSTYILSNPNEKLASLIERSGGLLPYADLYGAQLIRKNQQDSSGAIKKIAKKSISGNKTKAYNDSLDTDLSFELNEIKSNVAIDLQKILSNASDDLSLQDGDELFIPKLINTVDVRGEIYKPIKVQFNKNKSFLDYINDAGGFTNNAFKRNSFIVYSNGIASRSKKLLFFKTYPKVSPGSTIFIPQKEKEKEFDPSKFGVLISSLTAISTILVLLFK